MNLATRFAALAVVVLTAFGAQAQPANPPLDPITLSPAYKAAQTRWQQDLATFATADKAHAPGQDGILFVGSSTIRLWNNLAEDFQQQPVVINRGFGGSTMNDCSLFARDLVVRYKPRQVIVYAGDNDLAEGRTPMQVLESFAIFTSTVRAELPNARIAYISVKPSPARNKLLPQIRETNHMIAAYLQRLPNSEYIDIFTPMLGADGQPRAELFRADRLHMNDEGYRLWQTIITSHLSAPAGAAASAAASGDKLQNVPELRHAAR